MPAPTQLATEEQFEARHGAQEGPRAELIDALLEDATALILDELAGVEEDVAPWVTDDDEDVPASVVAVCIAVAYRAWRNPEALAAETLGAHSKTWRSKAQEAMYLTDRELRTVRRSVQRGSHQSLTLESPYSGPSDDPLSQMDFA